MSTTDKGSRSMAQRVRPLPDRDFPEPPPGEYELKLFVPPSSMAGVWTHPSIVDHAVGPLRIARVENRYFDTPERDLAGHRMALRLRRVAGRWVQTLKLAGEDEGALSMRGEWEMPVAGPALELMRLRDTPLATLAAPRTLGRRLQPVFATNFRRESRRLRLKDGSDVEFAFDVGVITAGRGRAKRTLSICEVEIEWKPLGAGAAAPDLMRFAARIARDIALIPLAASKAARGYRLADRKPLEPARVELPVPRPDQAPEAHLGRVLGACNRALLVNVHALVEVAASDVVDAVDGVDAGVEFLHQARVAIRRMRSALLTFRPVAKGRRFEALDEGLRSAGKRFGLARDWDVFVTTTMGRLEEQVGVDDEGRAALVALRAEAERMRADAHGALARFVDTGDFGATAIAVERMVARLAEEAKNADDRPLEVAGAKWLAAQRGRIVPRSRRIAVLDDEERHDLRIEVKQMRYALDLLDALYDREAVRDYRDALAPLQDKLGALNDASVADILMRTLPPTPALELVQARFRAWLHRHVRKQLPKVAALSVAFELAPQPWRVDRPGA